MRKWRNWETTREKVLLCGRVSRNGKPSACARVTLYKSRNTKSEPSTASYPKVLEGERALKTAIARPDGPFFFLNVKQGDYIIEAEAERGGDHGQNRARVSPDKEGVMRMIVSDTEISHRQALRA